MPFFLERSWHYIDETSLTCTFWFNLLLISSPSILPWICVAALVAIDDREREREKREKEVQVKEEPT